jgi:hypothetical protein
VDQSPPAAPTALRVNRPTFSSFALMTETLDLGLLTSPSSANAAVAFSTFFDSTVQVWDGVHHLLPLMGSWAHGLMGSSFNAQIFLKSRELAITDAMALLNNGSPHEDAIALLNTTWFVKEMK